MADEGWRSEFPPSVDAANLMLYRARLKEGSPTTQSAYSGYPVGLAVERAGAPASPVWAVARVTGRPHAKIRATIGMTNNGGASFYYESPPKVLELGAQGSMEVAWENLRIAPPTAGDHFVVLLLDTKHAARVRFIVKLGR